MKKRIKNDVKNFYKAQKIVEQAKDVLSNCSSKTDELDSYIVENQSSHELINTIIDSQTCGTIVADFIHKEKFEKACKLKNIIDARAKLKARRKQLFYYFSTTVAAAAIVLSLILLRPIPTKNIISNSTIIANHFTVPTLLLNNGETINLNEVKRKLISENIVMNRSGDNTISYDNIPTANSDTNTVVIPSKYTFNVVLDDGTEVFLNANSELRYSLSFHGEKREVFLKGEAYFRVAKSDKPFVVNANEVIIKAYGTEFNVNTNCINCIETILVNGSVGITSEMSEEIMLKPNELFTYNKLNKTIAVRNIVVANHLGCLNDLFKCDNEKLHTLLNRIATWYNVQFNYSDCEAAYMSVSVTFSRKSELETILKALETISNIKFVKKNQKEYDIE